MIKRLVSFLLAAVLLCTLTACGDDKKQEEKKSTPSKQPTVPYSSTPQKPTYYVTANKLNVRREPNTTSDVLGQLLYGTAVTVLDNEGDWYLISYQGAPAYISADYLTTEPVATSTAASSSATSATQTTPSATRAPASDYPDHRVPPLSGGLTDAQREELYTELKAIIAKNGSNYKNVYDYVIGNKKYIAKPEGESIEQMAYYTLTHQKVSCYYFAAFTYLLMQEAGYEVEFVRGLGWQTGTEHCWIMFKEADGWYFMDSLYVRSSKLTTKQCKNIGYKWNPTVHPEAK